nr:MAG TPA: hypothetical protein [Caudoviricetes sp.]
MHRFYSIRPIERPTVATPTMRNISPESSFV